MINKAEKKSSFLSFISTQRALALFILITIISLLFSFVFPTTFGTFSNFSIILLNMSSEIMIVIAITIVLIQGEIDLSLGSNMVLGAILCGRLMIVNDLPMIFAIIISLIVCMACGFINGLIVAKLNVVSFIGTLATGMIFLGFAVILSGTGWTDFPDKLFKALGQTKIMGIQMPVIYMIVALIIFAFLVSSTRYFRQYYYIGANQKAAKLSGINISKVKITTFVIAGCLAGIGGIITAMRFNTAIPNVGAGVELRAVTAAVIGGVSFAGGSGTVAGAAMGALFIAVLSNALTIAKLPPDLQPSITGVILITAIIIDIIVTKKNK
jgi:ribose transport system permease protein